MRQRTHAFTLVELLVVVSIIALLIAILLPSLKKARDQAKDVVGRSNMHQLGIAINYYVADNTNRLPWIKGTAASKSSATRYSHFPFKQYYQIFYMLPYLKEIDTFVCPQAKSVRKTGVRDLDSLANDSGHYGSVLGYNQGQGTHGDGISYYNVQKGNDMFLKMWDDGYFRESPDPRNFDPTDPLPYYEQYYSEYWFNDWSDGASDAQGVIPAISGNLVNRIPYPEHAVVMTDAVDWNPRHHGGNHFLFIDAHVSWIKEEKYYDPKGAMHSSDERTDRDPFGNYPYWCWGLGKNRH